MSKNLWWLNRKMDAAGDGGEGGGGSGDASGDANKASADGAADAGAAGEASGDASGADAGAGDANKVAATDWPEDWRQKYAGTDDKLLKRMERYASPKAALDALVAAQEKLRSGAKPVALKADASAEEVAAWRQENGIPAKAEDYDISLPDGLVIGEIDKPIVDGFLKMAHGENMTPDNVKKSLAWYYAEQDRQREMAEERDHESRAQAEETLREEWGQDYKRNALIANQFLDQAPEGLKDRIMGARLADGAPMGNDPAFLNFLVNLSREMNPVASVMPGSGTNAMQAMETEIAGYEKRMRDDRDGWFKDKKAQSRYQELITAKSKGR
jgi:hypothetical protein